VAANPLISLFGFSIGALVERLASREVRESGPGLGRLVDVHLVARSSVSSTACCSQPVSVSGNLIADILIYWADPRIRTESAGRWTLRRPLVNDVILAVCIAIVVCEGFFARRSHRAGSQESNTCAKAAYLWTR